MRKSCEIDASSVLRTRSVSVAVLALTMSRASEARSSAAAVCSDKRIEQRPRLRIERRRILVLCHADHAERLVADPQRHEIPRNDRQRPGVGAGRLGMAVGPARRRHGGGVERVFRRPRRGQIEIVVVRQQHHHRAAEAGVNFAGGAFGHGIERGKPGQAAGEFIEPPHRPHAAGGNLGLLAHAAGQRRGDDRDDQKDHQRQQFVRLGDGEGVDRLDEEEIVGQERQHRGVDRRPDAEAHGGQQHRHQEDHRQVRDRRQLGQQLRRCQAPRRPRASRTGTAAVRWQSRPAPPANLLAAAGVGLLA